MDKFQIYNRKLNKWEEPSKIINGWQENFVKDKTTDNAKIKLKYETAPDIEINDWCRILHINEKQKNAHLIESQSLDALVENETITIEIDNVEDYNENDYIIDLIGNLGLITQVLSDSIVVKRYFVNGLPIVQSENGATYKKQVLVHTNYVDRFDYIDIYSEPSRTGYKNWYLRLNKAFNEEIKVLVGLAEFSIDPTKTFEPGETGIKLIGELADNVNPIIKSIEPYIIFDKENITEYTQDVESITHIKYNEEKTKVVVYLEKPLLEQVDISFVYYTGSGNFPVLRTAELTFNAGEIYKEYTPSYEIYDDDNYLPDIASCTPETVQQIDYAYIPLNHEQYVIENINKVEDLVNNEWDVQLDLGEPINITKGIVCETKSHTNQIEKTVHLPSEVYQSGVDVKYEHRPLTHYTVLTDTLKLTPNNQDDYRLNYKRFDNKSWFNRIKIVNENFLDNIPFNDETYSEPILYEILLNKFDSSTGRTPVMYFDINIKTDEPINLERAEYVLQFERQDGLDTEELELDDLMKDRKEVMQSKTLDNFAEGIVSNFDNLAPSTKTSFVSENLWAVPEIDSAERNIDGYGVDSNKGIWVLKTPHLIKKVISINKLEVLVTGGTWSTLGVENFKRENTLLPVLELKQYNADNQNYDERNCAWFEEGKNLIHLNDYYYNPRTMRFLQDDTYRLIMYRVEYEPLISGRIDNNKDYQVVVNQVDGQIDSEKFGNYLVDYLNSMNKADLSISKTVENWEDILELGSRVVDGDKNYLITNIGIQNRGFEYDVVYQLNENHFRRNDSIVAPQEIRKNIEIGIETTKERKTVHPIKYSLGFEKQKNPSKYGRVYNYDPEIQTVPTSYFSKRKMLFSSLLKNYTDKQFDYPQIAYFKFKSKLHPNGAEYPNGIAIENYEIERLCELSRYNLGNSICFNMKYIDNAEAGKYKRLEKGAQALGIWTYVEAKYQEPILYTDYFGEIDNFDFKLIQTNIFDLDDIDISVQEEGLEAVMQECAKTNIAIQVSTNYPLTDGIEPQLRTDVLSIDGINYKKDMLDTFNWTFAIRYESDKKIIYCRNFFNNSILMTKNGAEIGEVRTYGQNMQENDFETAQAVQTAVVSNSTLTGDEITITLGSSLNTTKCIALVDTNGKPIIIINDWDKIENRANFNQIKLYC